MPTDLAAKVNLGGLVRLTARTPTEPSSAPPPESDDLADLKADPLWERLRLLRFRLSQEENRPAYSVFPDSTLVALVRDRPRTPNDLLGIKNFGAARLEKYGQLILNEIAGGPRPKPQSAPPPSSIANRTEPITHAIPPVKRPAPPPTSPSSTYVPTEEWTWRLLEKGFTPQEAAAIRGLELSAIIKHATLIARNGKRVPIEAFVVEEVLTRWRSWRATNSDVPHPDAETMPDAWSLFLACRIS